METAATKHDTKAKGDIAEQAAILRALEFGWDVLKPVGDRLPYDMVFVVNRRFIKIQVKSAWLNRATGVWNCKACRTKTNRRKMVTDWYSPSDFDFALVYIDAHKKFYVIPIAEFLKYRRTITMRCGTPKRQRDTAAEKHLEAWCQIDEWRGLEQPGSSQES